MVDARNRRRFTDPRAAAEAAFKAATTPKPDAPPPAAPAPAPAAAPGVREMVSLRLDSAVLAHFQKDGPGWQDRINAALKALVARAEG
ncbi:BrnA antitoxin family protein [Methylobacterium sp. NEAU 140]|uniref:BrnA antitoxin family protein n=1 Tax=Methylobacterium sp. NEAU 140 TaxID=3064945 RepID=UPI0027370DEF|nr:BrnA antitoxin family protein [Methylobacterium sp. NEAU 140]MDP4021851.1 BrnA antitoxin family protein [Methylobacterium sp. NEAU 140]